MPLMKSGISLQSDIRLGWKPVTDITGAPIPLYYDYETFDLPVNPLNGEQYDVIYMGPRYKHSIGMHKSFANRLLPNNKQSYVFKEPPNMALINQIIKQTHIPEPPREFSGMNPKLFHNNQIASELIFDSNFESGNLDMVLKKKDLDYDLYMRVDTNTRGHHQWFYFSVQSNQNFHNKRVRFNVVNFTKSSSLYHNGMKICISKRSANNFDWTKGCEDISYKPSLHGRPRDITGSQIFSKPYFQLSFTYTFTELEEKTFFAYCFPYDFSTLQDFLASQRLAIKAQNADHFKESVLCQSLGGVDVPLLTISSRINSDPEGFANVLLSEFQDPQSKISIPLYKKKRNIMICARVHPGESNSSFMMQGFISYILGNSFQARELRKRCVFRIIPMVNPDGVIIGNYRTNMAGNDLNRKYHAPDEKLHPTVTAIKKLVSNLTYPDGNVGGEVSDEDRVFAFIDMHGHSRKKNVFCYGPYYPLHNDKYLKMRILPKLVSEQTSKFRFFSCKFRIERSKEKAARIVLWREFSIMNCFTFEASFFGGQNDDRKIEEFTPASLEKMGEHLCNALYEYMLITEEDERQKRLKEAKKKKKKKKNVEKQQVPPTLQDQQPSQAAEGPKKQKKNQKQGAANVQSCSKRATPTFEEEKQTLKASAALNPNEPPESNGPEESRVDAQPDIQELRLLQGLGTGIRSIKDMFRILKIEDQKLQEGQIEEECSSNEDGAGDSPDKDSGSDSDPMEGELTGAEQAALYSNIKGTIDQFEDFFKTGIFKKRNMIPGPLKIMKKHQSKDQARNVKSPLPNPSQEQKLVLGSSQPKKPQKQEQFNQNSTIQIRPKKSLKQITEESRQYSLQRQQQKQQANIAQTKIEFYDSKDIPITSKLPLNQYSTIKNTGYQGISTHSYSVPQKDTRSASRGPTGGAPPKSALQGKLKVEEQSNMIPHKHRPPSNQFRDNIIVPNNYNRQNDKSSFYSTGQVTSQNMNISDQQNPNFQGMRKGFNPTQLVPSTQSSQVFGAKIDLNPRGERDQLSRQSGGRPRINKNGIPQLGSGNSTKDLGQSQHYEMNASRQVTQPQQNTGGNQGSSALSTYNFTNTMNHQQKITPQPGYLPFEYDLCPKDISLNPESRRLKSQRPLQGMPNAQQIRYNAIDMATVALLSQQMQLNEQTQPGATFSDPMVYGGMTSMNHQPQEHKALNAKQMPSNKAIVRQNDNRRPVNFQLASNVVDHDTYQYDPSELLITLPMEDSTSMQQQASQQPYKQGAASIVCGPLQNQKSLVEQAEIAHKFQMTTRMQQQMKGKGILIKRTPIETTPRGGTQKLGNQQWHEADTVQSSRANYYTQKLSNSPEKKRYTIHENSSNWMHPALTGEMSLHRASFFNQGANIALPDIYYINQQEQSMKANQHLRSMLGANQEQHRFKHGTSNIQRDPMPLFYDDFIFPNQQSSNFSQAYQNTSRGGSAALTQENEYSPPKLQASGGRPSFGQNQNHLNHAQQRRAYAPNASEKYQNIIDNLIQEQIPIEIKKT